MSLVKAVVAGVLIAGLAVSPAHANVSFGPDAGLGAAEVLVGKRGTCANDGSGNVSGGGLGFPIIHGPKLAWYRIDAPFGTGLSVVHGLGEMQLCGKIGPVDAGGQLGAACGSTKGWDGRGRSIYQDGAELWISNLTWKGQVGGTTPITADVSAAKGKKADLMLGVTQVVGEGVTLDCFTKQGTGDDKQGGVQHFDAVMAWTIVPGAGGQVPKKTGKPEPAPKEA